MRLARSTGRVLRRSLVWGMRAGLLALFGVALWVAAHARIEPPPGFFMRSEAARLGGIERTWVPLERIAPALRRATIAGEDARFCDHPGIDGQAIRAALAANAEGGRVIGGSTITQQVAKNVFLWPDRSWIRKGLEAGLALLIEATWTKARILEVYLNVAEFAPGVFGAEAAARHHFRTSAADLTAAEASLLAAVLPNPRVNDAGRPTPALAARAAEIDRGARVLAATGRAACAGG